MTTENEHETGTKINFFGQQNKSKKQVENENEESESEEIDSKSGLSSKDRLKLEKHRLDKQDENRKRIAGVILAAIGLFGVYMNIEYAGWLIFFGILML